MKSYYGFPNAGPSNTEFMREPGRGIARNTAFSQNWLNMQPAVLGWSEPDGDPDKRFLRFEFDPAAEISIIPSGIYFEPESFIANEES